MSTPDHLRFAGLPFDAQRNALEAILRDCPVLMEVLEGLRAACLPDCWLVSRAIYNQAWNALTGRPNLHGVKDVDVIYFDDTDLSYKAEDRIIRRIEALFDRLPLPVQVRNQARVHLWFPQKFGIHVPPLRSSTEALTRYASKTHAVAARLEADDTMTILAPFGLDLIFSFRVEPNRVLDNRTAHEAKSARASKIWPELTIVGW